MFVTHLHCLKKFVTTLSSSNFNIHKPVLTILGKCVNEKVGDQKILYFSSYVTSRLKLPSVL